MPVSAEDNITIYVNEQILQCDVAPYIENGRTMVPMRKIFEALDAKVDWEGTTPTNSLRRKITKDAQEYGRRFGYTRLQTENSIKFQIENSHPYWLVTDNLRDGFANYVGQSMSYDWIISKIGAGADFGVRAIIKVDNFKLSNYSN